MPRWAAAKAAETQRLEHIYRQLLAGSKVELIEGRAVVDGPQRVRVGERVLNAKHILDRHRRRAGARQHPRHRTLPDQRRPARPARAAEEGGDHRRRLHRAGIRQHAGAAGRSGEPVLPRAAAAARLRRGPAHARRGRAAGRGRRTAPGRDAARSAARRRRVAAHLCRRSHARIPLRAQRHRPPPQHRRAGARNTGHHARRGGRGAGGCAAAHHGRRRVCHRRRHPQVEPDAGGHCRRSRAGRFAVRPESARGGPEPGHRRGVHAAAAGDDRARPRPMRWPRATS